MIAEFVFFAFTPYLESALHTQSAATLPRSFGTTRSKARASKRPSRVRVSSVTKSTRHSRARDWLGGSHDPGIRSPDGRYANSPAKAAGHFEPLTALRGARLVRNSSQLLTCGEAPLGAGCGVESSAPHHRCRPRSSSEGGRGGSPHLRDAQSSAGRRAALPIEEACHAFGCHLVVIALG